MAAAETFKRQENPAGLDVPSSVSAPIQEESEEEEEVRSVDFVWESYTARLHVGVIYAKTLCGSPLWQDFVLESFMARLHVGVLYGKILRGSRLWQDFVWERQTDGQSDQVKL